MAEVKLRSAAGFTFTNVASPGAADTALLAANPLRKTLIITNNSTSILYIMLGTAAVTVTASNSFQLATLQHIVLEGYTGPVRGFHSASNGNINLTELT